jgi:hypothetical protein
MCYERLKLTNLLRVFATQTLKCRLFLCRLL